MKSLRCYGGCFDGLLVQIADKDDTEGRLVVLLDSTTHKYEEYTVLFVMDEQHGIGNALVKKDAPGCKEELV